MALATAIKKIETARKKYESEIAKVGRKGLAAELAKLIPEGFLIAWIQYTPSFNDGDPCTFTVGSVLLMTRKALTDATGEVGTEDDGTPIENDVIALSDDDREEFTDEDEGSIDLEYGDAKDLEWVGVSAKEFKALRKAWNTLPEALLETTFGDGVIVIVRDDGTFTVDEYDCGY